MDGDNEQEEEQEENDNGEEGDASMLSFTAAKPGI